MLLTTLPPPQSFTGPFVIIDKMCEALTNWTLPEDEKEGTAVVAVGGEPKANGVDKPKENSISSAPPVATTTPLDSMSAIPEEEDFTPDYSKLPILDPNLMSGTTGSTVPPSSADRKRRAGSIPSDRQGSQTPQHGRGRDSDDDDDVAGPPIKDIYRARQMQKKAR